MGWQLVASTQGLLYGDEAHVLAQLDANVEVGRAVLVEFLENNDPRGIHPAGIGNLVNGRINFGKHLIHVLKTDVFANRLQGTQFEEANLKKGTPPGGNGHGKFFMFRYNLRTSL